ncbi:hypothetical protein SLS56_000033 [Neofusicoccum ribis]|uniref:DUF6699 domain-containing protein n=1 Tax=Neofusicoccum ribis TaxID=45134 RepID=A0ABR3TFB7_9PEZI
MSADTAPLTKIDSAVEPGSPPKDHKEPKHRRKSSSATGVHNILDLATLDEWKDALKKPLVTPLVKKIDLHFPLGLEVTARNLKGVTIKDALDAIYKQFKKKADDELDNPILAGFEWDREECYTRFIVHQKKEGAAPPSKKSKKKKEEGA